MNELAGKRIAILVEQQYQELEVWYPALRFREAGAEVVFVGPEAGKVYPSKTGYPARSDRAVTEVSADEFDALVIPGGFAPDFMRRTPAMIDFVRDAARKGKVIAAICHGLWMLCSTPALRGRRVTSFFAIKDDVINAGGHWVDEEVVRDGNIISSRKPEDLPAFCRAIIEALTEVPATAS
jgi:protease I